MSRKFRQHSLDREQMPPPLSNATSPVVRAELDAIMPVIAASVIERLNADSCSFYIYDSEQSHTVASYREGESAVLLPGPTEVDGFSPQDVPVERYIIKARKPVRRSTPEDFERWPIYNKELRWRTQPYQDVVIPMIWHDEVHGVAYIWRTGDAPEFGDDEVARAEELTAVAAMAVQSAREVVRERARQGELNALLEVASLSSSHFTVDRAMPSVTRVIRSLTSADVCNLYVFDSSGEGVLNAYADGLNDQERWVFDESDKYPVSSVPVETKVRETLRPEVVTEFSSDLAMDSELVTFARQAGIQQILVVPIVYQGKAIGVIYVWYRDGDRRFSQETIETIFGIASQAGGVIEQARLYDESQQHISETEALRRIGQSVLNSDSLDVVLDEIAASLKLQIPYQYAFTGTLSDDVSSVVVSRYWGDFTTDLVGYRIPVHESLTGVAILEKRIVNVGDAHSSEKVHTIEPDTLPIRSVLIAPLTSDEGTIGALYIGRTENDAFTLRQERFMSLLANHAVAAISRTQARDALTLHARRQSFLAGVVDRLVAADDPLTVLQEIADSAAGLLADGVLIASSGWEHGTVNWEAVAHVDFRKTEDLRRSLASCDIESYGELLESLLIGGSVQGARVRNGHPFRGDNVELALLSLLQDLSVSGVLVAPMARIGRAPGLVILLSTKSGGYLDRDSGEIAQIAANRIGNALERRQMVLNRESLLTISRSITSRTDTDELLNTFVDELARIIPFDTMYLGNLNEERTRIGLLKHRNPFGIPASAMNVATNQGLSGEVIRTRTPVVDNIAHLRASVVYANEEEASYFRKHGESAMAAPLIADGEVIGVLFVSRFGTNRFSSADFETFLLFASLAASAMHRTSLLESNQAIYRASVEVLAAVVDAKDPTTFEHSQTVARYTRLMAERMGLEESDVERMELAALLHDIGKLSIPDHVLSKPGPLTAQERMLINTHSDRGADILAQHPQLVDVVPLVRHHHERFDGGGYPAGLSGEQIPLGASVIAVADAFETMISPRTYQRRKSVSEALGELHRCSGTLFDPAVVQSFTELFQSGERSDGVGHESNPVYRTSRANGVWSRVGQRDEI